jgi:hypothetical protein
MNGLAEPIRVTAVVEVGMIQDVELEDVITIAEAQEIALGLGDELSASYIARAAKSKLIVNSRKSGHVWIMEKSSFLDWFHSRRSRGRPVEVSE